MALLIVAIAALMIFLATIDCNPSLFVWDAILTFSDLSQTGPAPLRPFKGRTFWVTGASSGIGEEYAARVCELGGDVVVSGRREANLLKLKARCSGGGAGNGRVHVLPFDLLGSSEEGLRVVTAEALKAYGKGIDVLVLNAGRSQRSKSLDTPIEATKELMELNFVQPALLATVVMKADDWKGKQKGHIVLTSSVAGKLPVALSTSYSASKAAASAYFGGLRSENNFLRVDVVCPGPVATGIALAAHAEAGADLGNEAAEGKMPAARCANLMISAARGPWFLMYEVWISEQPVLLFTALSQYCPTCVALLSKVVGPKRVEAFEAGLDVYKMSSWK